MGGKKEKEKAKKNRWRKNDKFNGCGFPVTGL